jgi:hypothetical protein
MNNEQELRNKYSEFWNNSLQHLQSEFDKDKKEFHNDNNIGFKWTHLMQQEIEMWITQCCGDVTEWEQVPMDDFEFIINRRGFTPRIITNLRNILIEVGIGNELK